jgi:hypothetical protein
MASISQNMGRNIKTSQVFNEKKKWKYKKLRHWNLNHKVTTFYIKTIQVHNGIRCSFEKLLASNHFTS